MEDAVEDVAEVFSLNVASFAGNRLEGRLETNDPVILLRICWRWLKEGNKALKVYRVRIN